MCVSKHRMQKHTYLNGYFGFFGLKKQKHTYFNGYFGFFGFSGPGEF